MSCCRNAARTVEAACNDGAGRKLWNQIEALGLLDTLAPEAKGDRACAWLPRRARCWRSARTLCRCRRRTPWSRANCGVAELGALVTAALMAGAMQRVLDITLGYVNDHWQFGRPLGKFQAVQQQLSVMAEHVAATRVAAQLGCAGHGTSAQHITAAIAKARASRAATAGGAMGTTTSITFH